MFTLEQQQLQRRLELQFLMTFSRSLQDQHSIDAAVSAYYPGLGTPFSLSETILFTEDGKFKTEVDTTSFLLPRLEGTKKELDWSEITLSDRELIILMCIVRHALAMVEQNYGHVDAYTKLLNEGDEEGYTVYKKMIEGTPARILAGFKELVQEQNTIGLSQPGKFRVDPSVTTKLKMETWNRQTSLPTSAPALHL